MVVPAHFLAGGEKRIDLKDKYRNKTKTRPIVDNSQDLPLGDLTIAWEVVENMESRAQRADLNPALWGLGGTQIDQMF